jgi:hypothetical protein
MFSLYTHQCKQPFINKIFWRDHHVTTVNQCDCCIKAPKEHGSALIWVAGSGSAFKLRIQQVQVKLFSLPPSYLRKNYGTVTLEIFTHTQHIPGSCNYYTLMIRSSLKDWHSMKKVHTCAAHSCCIQPGKCVVLFHWISVDPPVCYKY